MRRFDRSEKPDQAVQQALEALAPYEAAHPAARIEARRHNPVSIRLRIIDRDFERVDKVSREEMVWTFLDTLPDDVVSDITMVILLTPDEAAQSVASFEFDNPVPSWLS